MLSDAPVAEEAVVGARKPGLLNWLELLLILPASSFLAPLARILATAMLITPVGMLLDTHPNPNNPISGKPLPHVLVVFGFYHLGSAVEDGIEWASFGGIAFCALLLVLLAALLFGQRDIYT